MSRLAGQGAVALLELDAEATAALIADYPDVSLAVYASPRQTVIAGPPQQVDAVIAAVDGQDRFARRVEWMSPRITAPMDPILPELRSALADLTPQSPTIPVHLHHCRPHSQRPIVGRRILGSQCAPPGAVQPGRHRRRPRPRAPSSKSAPTRSLTHAITETLGRAHHHSIGTLWRDTDDTLSFHTNLNTTHTTHPPHTPHPPEPHPPYPPPPGTTPSTGSAIKSRWTPPESTPRPGTLLGEHISVATTPPAHLWQARLAPEAKPYPGRHRIHGMELVPVSVLLQTLSAAAAESGASILSDVRFEYPIVVDQPRVIQVIADDQSVTLSSSPAADTPSHRWIRHATARISQRLDYDERRRHGHERRSRAVRGFDASSVAELQRAWGIEGQPFPWSIGVLPLRGGWIARRRRLPEASTVALLDAAVHVARLADSSNPRLLFPASVESVRFAAELTDAPRLGRGTSARRQRR